ncbi:ATP-binding protein [Streptomyces sp. NPDC087903]|uniref:ATP-binding protein n=1 Tax=Streptomyces sp. NPDC087903 TaxID=3365819 RepID=UPI0037F97CC2
MNEENYHGCRAGVKKFLLSPSDCQPAQLCSGRRPPSSEHESEALILRLHCVPVSVPASRRHTRELMTSWQISPPVTDTVALVVSELVTNAVQHSGGQQKLPPHRDAPLRHFDLAIYLRTKHVRVEVYDEESRLPVHAESDEYAEAGRGIKIIQFCVLRWGARRLCTGGKVTWCDVSIPGSSRVDGTSIKA